MHSNNTTFGQPTDGLIRVYDGEQGARTTNLSSWPNDRAAWAAACLATLPTVITFATRPVTTFTVGGDEYRNAGWIEVSPLGDRPHFSISLAAGADENDLAWFREVIENAKAGVFGAWQAQAERADSQSYVFEWSRLNQNAPTISPRLVLECTESPCLDAYHLADDPSSVEHVALRMSGPPSPGATRSGYTITVFKFAGDPWMVNVVTEDVSYTTGQVPKFVSDLQWANVEAKKLNA